MSVWAGFVLTILAAAALVAFVEIISGDLSWVTILEHGKRAENCELMTHRDSYRILREAKEYQKGVECFTAQRLRHTIRGDEWVYLGSWWSDFMAGCSGFSRHEFETREGAEGCISRSIAKHAEKYALALQVPIRPEVVG